MSVDGGRFRWRRALAWGSWASAGALCALVGCGGRTSALDSDAYGIRDDGFSEGGSSRGGSGSAGRPVSGAAGSGPAPVGGSSSVDPNVAVGPCNRYCPGYGAQCAERLMGQDCQTACQAEVSGFGPKCQSLGISALECLTPFFAANGGSCDAAVNRALARCGSIVEDFQRCKGVPTNPGMPTMPMPTSPLDDCEGMGSGDARNCMDTYACGTGLYLVNCAAAGASEFSDCFCLTPNNGLKQGTIPNDDNACRLAATILCR